MSWDDIFGLDTETIKPVAVTVPRAKGRRSKYTMAMARELVSALGKTWDETPGDDRITYQEACDKLLSGMESGRFN